jgi:hypothetical protein
MVDYLLMQCGENHPLINLPFLYTLHLNVLFETLEQVSLFLYLEKYNNSGVRALYIMDAHINPATAPMP